MKFFNIDQRSGLYSEHDQVDDSTGDKLPDLGDQALQHTSAVGIRLVPELQQGTNTCQDREMTVNIELTGYQATLQGSRRVQMPSLGHHEYNLGTGNRVNVSVPQALHSDACHALAQLALRQ